MNNKLRSFYFSFSIALSSVFGMSLSVHAQSETRQEGAIQSQDFTIEKERKIEIQPEIQRSFNPLIQLNLAQEDSLINYNPKDYKWENKSFQNLEVSVIEPGIEDKYILNEIGKIKNNVKIGLGNYGHTLLNSNLAYSLKANQLLGLYLNLDANASGPDNTAFSRRQDNQIKVYSKNYTLKYLLDGSLGFRNLGSNYYGRLSIPDGTAKDAYKINYDRFSFNGRISNTDLESRIDYQASTDFNYIQASNTNSEYVWKNQVNADWDINSEMGINFNSDLYVSEFTKDNANINRNLYRIQPNFNYKTNGIKINLGLNIVGDLDQSLSKNPVNWYPNIQIDYRAMPSLNLYGGIKGNTYFNSLSSMSFELPWLGKDIELRNTREIIHIFAGLKGSEDNGLSYEFKLGYSNLENLSFFTPSMADTSQFEILYSGNETQKTGLFNLSGNIDYQVNPTYKTNLKFIFNNYSKLSSLEQPYSRPKFNLEFTNHYQFRKSITISPNLYYISGLYGYRPNVGPVKMKSIVDLNLKLDYSVNEKINTYLSMNNLLGTKYQRYINYQVQGFNLTVGASYTF